MIENKISPFGEKLGVVAQLVRATDSYPVGRKFNSYPRYKEAYSKYLCGGMVYSIVCNTIFVGSNPTFNASCFTFKRSEMGAFFISEHLSRTDLYQLKV